MPATRPVPLRTATVLRVAEDACEVRTAGRLVTARFTPRFPTPRTERVAPGHLVALATAPQGDEVVVWRWYDAVVLSSEGSGPVRLWEPAHGEVLARPRDSHRPQEPGTRAYASAGLPGADWWVAGPVGPPPEEADVDLDAVADLYADSWTAALAR